MIYYKPGRSFIVVATFNLDIIASFFTAIVFIGTISTLKSLYVENFL